VLDILFTPRKAMLPLLVGTLLLVLAAPLSAQTTPPAPAAAAPAGPPPPAPDPAGLNTSGPLYTPNSYLSG